MTFLLGNNLLSSLSSRLYLVSIKETKNENEYDTKRGKETYFQKNLYMFFSDDIDLFLIQVVYTLDSIDDLVTSYLTITKTTQNFYDSLLLPSLSYFKCYEQKKVYLSQYFDSECSVIECFTEQTNSSKTIHKYQKLVDVSYIWYGENIGYQYYPENIKDYVLTFTPTNFYYNSIDESTKQRIKTVLKIASRNDILASKSKVADCWLPLELWHMILEKTF
jgi:hypothetical protein